MIALKIKLKKTEEKNIWKNKQKNGNKKRYLYKKNNRTEYNQLKFSKINELKLIIMECDSTKNKIKNKWIKECIILFKYSILYYL